MIRYSYIIIISIAALIALQNNASADENYSEIGLHIPSIAIDSYNRVLAFGIYENDNHKIVITNTDLENITSLSIDYFPNVYSFSNDGLELYLGMFDLVDQLNITAQLEVVNTSNWSSEAIYSLPNFPGDMYYSQLNNALYVTCGHVDYQRINLIRLDRSPNGDVIRKDFGDAPASGITMNHDETKLYVFDSRIYVEYSEVFEPTDTYCKMHIMDPFTLEILNSVRMDCFNVLDLAQGPIGFILLAHGSPSEIHPASLTVFDTTSDTVDRVIETPDYYGCRDLRYDATRNLVYAVAFKEEEYFDQEREITRIKGIPQNRVLIFDLSTDQVSWSPVFPELVGQIALSPDGNRLYAGSAQPGSKKVFYMDLY